MSSCGGLGGGGGGLSAGGALSSGGGLGGCGGGGLSASCGLRVSGGGLWITGGLSAGSLGACCGYSCGGYSSCLNASGWSWTVQVVVTPAVDIETASVGNRRTTVRITAADLALVGWVVFVDRNAGGRNLSPREKKVLEVCDLAAEARGVSAVEFCAASSSNTTSSVDTEAILSTRADVLYDSFEDVYNVCCNWVHVESFE